MPSMLDSRSPAVSDYRISTTNNPHIQSQITSEPLFPWQDHQQSALFGHAPYSSRFDTKYSTSHPQVSKEAYEDAAQGRWTPGRWGAWGDEVRQGPAMPFIPSPFPPNNSFQSNDDLEDSVSAASSTPRPTLPLPFRCNPRPRWAESPMGNTLPLHDIRTAPQPQSPPLFSYDAADHTGPPFYSTASNLQAIYQPSMKRLYQDTEDDMTVVSYETDGESKQSEPPYAKLIYQALMAAPGYRMVLRDIYQWIGENTDKAKDPAFKGWQNSVRHNLSMNGAFKKVPYDDPSNKSKKGFIWLLEESAVGKGIQSTTRYRQKTVSKKSEHSQILDPKRQRSGRKGGKAARRITSRLRRPKKPDDPRSSYYFQSNKNDCYRTGTDMALNSPLELRLQASPGMDLNPSSSVPYWLHTPPMSARSSLPCHLSYNYGDPNDFSEAHSGQGSYITPPDSTINCSSFDGTDNCNSFEDASESMLPSNSGNTFEDHFLSNGLSCLS